ncbi:hypothetical protein JCM10212_007064 [Sporobolomyces blumeae]
MTLSRPSTPSSSPRKPLASSSRPSSRASSRPASPTKPSTSSINNPFPRPSSALGLGATLRSGARPSTASNGEVGRTSPTKRTSLLRPLSASPTKSSSSASSNGLRCSIARAPGPSASNSSFASTVSVSSTASARKPNPTRNRVEDPSSARSSDAGCSTDDDREREGDDDDDDHDNVPRRRPGFGPLSTPRRPARKGHETETETEGEGGFLTAEEGALTAVGGAASNAWSSRNQSNGSIVESSSGEDASETETETEEPEEEKDGKTENVVVCLRVRPSKSSTAQTGIYTLNPSEATLNLAPSHPTLLKRGGKTSDEYEFRFDLLHVAPDPTERLYDRKIRPVVKAALNGFNGTVFAYGQTASGKTHTMMGSPTEPGIIPLAIDELFSYIHKQNTSRRYSLRVAFLEIYNEHLRDLLAVPASTGTARQPEIVEGGTVKNLEERPVSMPNEVLDVLREGEQRRRVGQTDWNERSSRSHCVFIVTIESMSKAEDGTARTSQLNLIDLAGSESATGQEERRKEGSFINKSLLTLGTVIGKLTEPHGSNAHIPYRDSKLTRLLQPALSGNSRVAVVCTVSPDVEQATETLSTLKFAKRAKMVVTKAERGVLVTDQMMLKQYAAQVERLQSQIRRVEGGDILRERDLAARRADEAERRGREAQDALAEKELELSRLRSQLAHTQSLILTGPTIEANVRRVSGSFAGSMLSPSRSRSLNYGGAGKRTASEMSGLGLGTPGRTGELSWRSGLSESVSRMDEEEEEHLRERESDLARQLEEATTKLASLATSEDELVTLRAQVTQLQKSSSLARLDAEKSAQASQDRRARIQELERELVDVREQLRVATEDRDRLALELSGLRRDVEDLRRSKEEEANAARLNLKQLEQAVESAREQVRTRDRQTAELQATLASTERQLARKEADAKLPDARDDQIASFARQVDSIKQELAAVTAAKTEAVQAALDQVSDVRKERDLALRSVEEAERRIKDVEQLVELQAARHEAAEQQTANEKAAATAALQAEVDRLNDDLAAKVDKVAQLQRGVEAFERLEAQRTRYEADQRYGTDKLKSRMAELQARTATPTPVQRPPPSLSSSTGSNSDPACQQQQQQQVRELQVRNGELLARVTDLERTVEASSSSLRRDKAEMEGEIEKQKRVVVETEAKAEDWRQKYLAAQRLLDKLTGSSLLDSSVSSENVPPLHRASLSEINLPSDSSRSSLSTSTSSRRPPLAHSSTSSLSHLSSGSVSSSSLSRTASAASRPPPSPSPALGSILPSSNGYWATGKPPPLPSSPHQKSKERKHRRETIAKDLAKLQQVKVVEERKGGWTSPSPAAPASPTKGEFDRGSASQHAGGQGGGGSSSYSSARRAPTDLFGIGSNAGTIARDRKSSWE